MYRAINLDVTENPLSFYDFVKKIEKKYIILENYLMEQNLKREQLFNELLFQIAKDYGFFEETADFSKVFRIEGILSNRDFLDVVNQGEPFIDLGHNSSAHLDHHGNKSNHGEFSHFFQMLYVGHIIQTTENPGITAKSFFQEIGDYKTTINYIKRGNPGSKRPFTPEEFWYFLFDRNINKILRHDPENPIRINSRDVGYSTSPNGIVNLMSTYFQAFPFR